MNIGIEINGSNNHLLAEFSAEETFFPETEVIDNFLRNYGWCNRKEFDERKARFNEYYPQYKRGLQNDRDYIIVKLLNQIFNQTFLKNRDQTSLTTSLSKSV